MICRKCKKKLTEVKVYTRCSHIGIINGDTDEVLNLQDLEVLLIDRVECPHCYFKLEYMVMK